MMWKPPSPLVFISKNLADVYGNGNLGITRRGNRLRRCRRPSSRIARRIVLTEGAEKAALLPTGGLKEGGEVLGRIAARLHWAATSA